MDDVSSIAVARQVAREGARAVGRSEDAAEQVALAASELATNICRHADRGELLVLPHGDSLALVAVDDGPGIADLEACLVDGYSTAGTLGAGLGTVRRLAGTFDGFSEPGRGTVIAATFGPVPAGLDVGGIDFPMRGEADNGDSWSVVRRGSRVVALLADGLGHGGGAALASRSAVRGLSELADLAPGPLVELLHARLRGSRGAALTVCSTDLASLTGGGPVAWAGLGNVSLVLLEPDGTTRRTLTTHGTAGVGRTGTVRQQTAVIPAGSLLVLHSDGLSGRWDFADRPALLRHSALVVAAVLLREHERGSDDLAVLVLRAT